MPSPPAVALLISLVLLIASAALADDDDTLKEVIVTASADASAAGLTSAYPGGQVARGGRVGVFGSEDMMDTPFSITNYTQQLIQDTQAASIGDVLQNDGGVRVARGFGNFQQLYIVRGLPVYSDDMSYNGLYGLLPRQYLAAELVERVEVLHGASAFLNGAAPGGSGLGGAVNVSPKRAPNTPLDEFTVGWESGSQKYLAADVARRFGPEENFGIRINAVRRDGGTAVDGEHRSLTVGGIGLDFHASGLRVSGDVGYQNHQLDRSQPSVTVTESGYIPPAPEADQPLGQPWTFSDERDVFGTLRAEYDILPSLTAWVAAGARDGRESAVFGNPTVTDDNGTTSTYRFDNARHDQVETGELGLRYHFVLAGISQQLIASAAAYELNSQNAYAFSNFAGFAGSLYASSAVPPPPADYFLGGNLADPLTTARTKTRSVALADQLGLFEDQLLVSVGGRYQRIEALNYDYTSGDLSGDYAAGRITPVAGVLYKFSKSVSLYGNYIEGLVQGDTAPNTYTDASGTHAVVNAGEIFRPYATRQGELGAKYDGGTLGTTFSLFYSAKPVASVDLASGRYQVTDYQRNRGAELTAFGEPFPGVRILAGVSYLHAEVEGERAIGSPRFQGTAGLEWDVPHVHGLTVDGRALYTTAQYADADDTQRVPSWTRLDAGARYALSLGPTVLTLRGRVENLTNRNQWVSVGGYPGSGYLVLGDPRTFMVNATVAF